MPTAFKNLVNTKAPGEPVSSSEDNAARSAVSTLCTELCEFLGTGFLNATDFNLTQTAGLVGSTSAGHLIAADPDEGLKVVAASTAAQSVTLTDNATNYGYVDENGAVTVVQNPVNAPAGSVLAWQVTVTGGAWGTISNHPLGRTNYGVLLSSGHYGRSVAGASNVALTAAEARHLILNFSGALTGNINVTVPAATPGRAWIVNNATSGAFTLTFKTVSGAGIVVPQGYAAVLWCDGTNIVKGSADSGASTYTAGAGLALTGSDFSVNVDGATLEISADTLRIKDLGVTTGKLAANAATNAKLAQMATARIKGRTTAGTGDPEDLTGTQTTALLDNLVGDSGAGGTKGLAPAPAAGDAAAAKFLKADGTWAVPATGTTVNAIKDPVRIATTANITLSGTATVIDGITPSAGDRVLVKNQTTASENGIYVAAAIAWSRATDADASAEVLSGMLVAVQEGTANADTVWQLTTNAPITLGTTGLTFARYPGTAAPVATGTANAEGSAITYARSDHVHAIGDGTIAPADLGTTLEDALGDVTLSVGSEVSNQIDTTIQVRDANGNNLAEQVYLRVWIADTATGIPGTALDGFAATTGDAINTVIIGTYIEFQTNTSGVLVIRLTKTSGAATRYLRVVLGSKIYTSSAIVFV